MALCAALLMAALPIPGGTAILTYHDVIDRRGPGSVWFDCTTDELQSQISWLRARGARFVSIGEVVEAFRHRRSLPRGSVAICFADNYAGFVERGWPVLRRERVPVTLFVHTGFVGSSVGRRKASWGDLSILLQDPLVTVASQTVSHPADLRKLSDRQLADEFSRSRSDLERRLPRSLPYIAYPNGKFDERVAAIARRSGYCAGFTESARSVEQSNWEMTIPRWVHTRYREAWWSANAKR